MSNRRILITGASGFVGSHVLAALQQSDDHIIAIARQAMDQLTDPRVQWIQADINDPDSYESKIDTLDAIIHIAGLVSYDPISKTDLYHVNQEGTSNLINFALAKKVKKFIYLSSASTLRRSSNESLISENVPGSPVFYSHYARSKFLGEMEVRRGEAEGLEIAIINPSLIIGLGDWAKGSCSIFRKAYQGLRFYPSGDVGLVHIDDVVKACVIVLNQANMSRDNLLLNAETWTYKNLFGEMCRGFNHAEPKFKVGLALSRLASIFDYFRSKITRQERLISPESILQINQRIQYDNQLTKKILNFEFESIQPKLHELCLMYADKIIKP